MKLLRNIWYAAAWSHEIDESFATRELLGEPMLLYRKHDGTPVAMIDRCPHRFAPLSMGKRVGDSVECGYHGLRFDCSGACTLNPHGDGRIPQAARVRTFPVVDLHGLVWLWPGDPARADIGLIPDCAHLVSPRLKTIGGQMIHQAHYELVVDNLMDLSHVNYVHAPYQQVDDFLRAKHDVVQTGATLESRRTVPSTRAPQSFRPFLADPDTPVEYWLNIRWHAPGCCVLETGVVPIGEPRENGLVRIGTHLVTPITASSTRYVYASSRNYRLDDPLADDETARWQQMGFHEQDKPMIKAVQSRMGDRELFSMRPILLATDGPAVRARRLLAAMIEEEARQSEHACAALV
ncbi:vanillate monooxygenase [Caballeronia cordobensis]|uniref:Vanillate monooxygenase n=1 Tax=Caballeronia cordobensis TaxID=1353886 RepID=A0A158HNK4_CABCO|nr:aromatic ring-hydroxylating dioxygenase subunit alpha [Caballeronia cordobensis]SAL45599.1 vanillate monooxygenase [Caballeronia cordobensis]